MPQHRKILFIVIDQLRADCIVGALAKHTPMPNIAALRQDAVTFTQHYSVTNPCGPSRASLLTGRYAMNHRSVRNGTPLADHIPNIARELRKSGFNPMLFGYSDTSIDPRTRHPKDPDLKSEERVLPGLTEMLEMRFGEAYPWRAHLKAKGYTLPDYAHFYDSISPDGSRPARPDDPPFYRAEDSDTAFMTDAVLRDLSVRVDQDWFALVTYLRPHPPLVAPAPYNTLVDPATLPLPERMQTRAQEAKVHPFMDAAQKSPDMNAIVRGCGRLDPDSNEDVQQLRAIYLGLAAEVDTHIGRLINLLKDSGQYDDTVIVLTADHGEMLGDHHMWGKQNPYDPAYRVPLIIRDPAQAEQHGSTIEAFSESIDLMPTLLDLIGQDAPAGLDGHSLRPFLCGDTPPDWRDCVHMELDFSEPNHRTKWQEATEVDQNEANLAILREERFKLVHFNGDLAPLLFDVVEDPFELTDLAGDPAHAATLLRLTRKLLSHRMANAESTYSGVKITSNGAFGFKP